MSGIPCRLEMFYLNSTLNFGIPPSPVLVFQLEVYYKLDRLLTGPTAQQKKTTARWYSNKTSLIIYSKFIFYLRVGKFTLDYCKYERKAQSKTYISFNFGSLIPNEKACIFKYLYNLSSLLKFHGKDGRPASTMLGHDHEHNKLTRSEKFC